MVTSCTGTGGGGQGKFNRIQSKRGYVCFKSNHTSRESSMLIDDPSIYEMPLKVFA